jgi:hypothetical protein
MFWTHVARRRWQARDEEPAPARRALADTVHLGPATRLEPLSGEHRGALILTDVVEHAGAEDVVVIANGGRVDVSSWGGILSVGATLRSVRGVVTDVTSWTDRSRRTPPTDRRARGVWSHSP